MKKIQKTVAFFMTLVMLIFMSAVFSVALAESSVEWEFDEPSGHLRFYGHGSISDTSGWSSFKPDIREITIDSGITRIAPSVFERLPQLKSVTMTDVTLIDRLAFFNCAALEKVVLGRVATINFGAFAKCYSLSSCELPDTLTYIDVSAFHSCTKLRAVLPKNVTYLGERAFYGCRATDGLLVIPPSVTYIGFQCFDNCPISSVLLMNHTLSQTLRPEAWTPGETTSIFGSGTELESILVLDANLPISNLSVFGTENPFAYDCSRLTVYSPAGSLTEAFATQLGLPCQSLESLVVGDVNDDGEMNTSDAHALMRTIVYMSDYDAKTWYLSDINGDGQVDASDVRSMMIQLVQ